jgi:hypothetical protein
MDQPAGNADQAVPQGDDHSFVAAHAQTDQRAGRLMGVGVIMIGWGR